MRQIATRGALVSDFGRGATHRRLAVVCSQERAERTRPALDLAGAALDEGLRIDLFFTSAGLGLVVRPAPGAATDGVRDVHADLDRLTARGAHLWACRSSLERYGLGLADLRGDVESTLTGRELIVLTEHAQLLFV